MKTVILSLLGFILVLTACSNNENRPAVAILTPVTHPSLEQIEKGFVETIEQQFPGKYRFVTYNAQGNKSLMRSEIEEILLGDFRLVLTIGAASTQMTKEVFQKNGTEIPIVFSAVDDPVGLGIIDSELLPGGYTTGVKQEMRFGDEIDSFMRYLPNLSRILIVYNPVEAGLQKDVRVATEILRDKNIAFNIIEVFNTNELKVKVSSQLDGADAILVVKDNTVVSGLDVLSKLCDERKIPLLASDLDSPRRGAAMGYGVFERDFGVDAARKALLILEESRKPGEIPVTPVADFTLIIDREAAQRQGIRFKEGESL